MADLHSVAPGGIERTEPIEEIDVLWITAGLGCDGDTIAMTAATNPSIEEVLLGAIPGIPRVRLHNPFLAYEVGDDFLERFHQAAEGRPEPFILVIEGSIPDEKNKTEGYWAAFGTDRGNGQQSYSSAWERDRMTTCRFSSRLSFQPIPRSIGAPMRHSTPWGPGPCLLRPG